MLIQPARTEDYAAYCALFLEINAYHASAQPEIFNPAVTIPRSQEDYLAILGDPTQAIFVAWEEDQAAGYIHLLQYEAPPIPILNPRRCTVVDTVVVSKKFKRKGIGRALMAIGESWARQHGMSFIELGVYEFNQGAIQFYEELGFEVLSRKMRKKIDP
jgi:GNAT superfamily N-acetyltransferase